MKITDGLRRGVHRTSERIPLSRVARILAVFEVMFLLLVLPAEAGNLAFFEASVGSGNIRAISRPANNVLLDLDYAPSTAEGGVLFGFSEVLIQSTGDLSFTISGFLCEVAACLHYPLPFASGNSLLITGGEDLAGEVAGTLDLLTISVSGNNGYVAIVSGEYLDSTGSLGAPGQVQSIGPTILASVPEPHVALGMMFGALSLCAAGRRRANPSGGGTTPR